MANFRNVKKICVANRPENNYSGDCKKKGIISMGHLNIVELSFVIIIFLLGLWVMFR